MEEIWKDIEGWEGFYQISNLGRVKSLERACGVLKIVRNNKDGSKTVYNKEVRVKEKLRKLVKTGRQGRVHVNLVDKENNRRENRYVSRLVAQAFIPNPNNLPEVNHKNRDIYNNTVDNLEWSNGVYNKKHSTIGRKNLTSLYDLAYKEGKTASEMLDTLIEYYKAKATMN